MAFLPAPDDKAVAGFAILGELIQTLVDKGVLSKAEVTAMLKRASDGMAKDTRASAKSAPKVIEEVLSKYRE